MKIKSLVLSAVLILAVACTDSFTVKNRAIALSAEQFDNEVIAISKEQYPDAEQQKVFADFIKKYSRVDVDNVDVKGDSATAELTIRTPAKSVYPELKAVSGKEWQAKIDAAMENRKYALTLKKTNNTWQITEQKDLAAK